MNCAVSALLAGDEIVHHGTNVIVQEDAVRIDGKVLVKIERWGPDSEPLTVLFSENALVHRLNTRCMWCRTGIEFDEATRGWFHSDLVDAVHSGAACLDGVNWAEPEPF